MRIRFFHKLRCNTSEAVGVAPLQPEAYLKTHGPHWASFMCREFKVAVSLRMLFVSGVQRQRMFQIHKTAIVAKDCIHWMCRQCLTSLSIFCGVIHLTKVRLQFFCICAFSLHDDMMDGMAEELLINRRLFTAADSAHILCRFMLARNNKTEMGDGADGSLDVSNFYLSFCRVNIEYAFGELWFWMNAESWTS